MMRFSMFLPCALLAALVLLWAPASAFAQDLPFHADTNARELAVNPDAVPAIRFLTTTDFPPFNYTGADGALVGFNIDLAEALCETLNAVCTVQPWPWDQVSDALAENQGDALIGGLAISGQTGEKFDFSNIYLALPGRFVTRQQETSGFDPEAPDQKISVAKGGAHEEWLKTYLPDAQIVEAADEFSALGLVETGEVAAYFGDAMRASFWLNTHMQCCAFAGEPYFNPHFFGDGMAIAVNAGRGTLRKAMDYGLVRLQRSGKLDEIYLRWFPVSFY